MDINIVAKCNGCVSSPCKNNGTCSQDPVELYRCTCPYGYKVRQGASPPPSMAQGGALCPADPPFSQGGLENSILQVTPEWYLPVTLLFCCPVMLCSGKTQRTPTVLTVTLRDKEEM